MKILILVSLCFCINSCLSAQDVPAEIKSIGEQLSSGQTNITAVLTNKNYMKLHSSTEFRNLLKRNAKQEKITLVTKDEPGIPLTVNGRLVSADGQPAANMLIYVYHTDNSGSYGERGGNAQVGGNSTFARLFGYLRTANDGSFSFNTIHPQGYPDSGVPQHIHIEVYDNNDRQLLVSEFLFAEDARLGKDMKERMQSEGFVVASNKGSNENHVYSYELRLKNN